MDLQEHKANSVSISDVNIDTTPSIRRLRRSISDIMQSKNFLYRPQSEVVSRAEVTKSDLRNNNNPDKDPISILEQDRITTIPEVSDCTNRDRSPRKHKIRKNSRGESVHTFWSRPIQTKPRSHSESEVLFKDWTESAIGVDH